MYAYAWCQGYLQHYKECHQGHSLMSYYTTTTIPYNTFHTYLQTRDLLLQYHQHTLLRCITTLGQRCIICATWLMLRACHFHPLKWTRTSLLSQPLWLDSSQTQPTEWTVWVTTVMEWRPVWRPTSQSPHVGNVWTQQNYCITIWKLVSLSSLVITGAIIMLVITAFYSSFW